MAPVDKGQFEPWVWLLVAVLAAAVVLVVLGAVLKLIGYLLLVGVVVGVIAVAGLALARIMGRDQG